MKKLLTLLFTSVFVFSLTMPVFAQGTTGQETAPKAEKKVKVKKAKKIKAEKQEKKEMKESKGAETPKQ
jgi:hypothetical protein